jgi:hypothetical protein
LKKSTERTKVRKGDAARSETWNCGRAGAHCQQPPV